MNAKRFFIKVIGLLLVLISCHVKVVGQNTINGRIVDSSKTGLPAANIILKKTTNRAVLAFTFSDKDGFFSIEIKDTSYTYLEFSSIGYKTNIVKISSVDKFLNGGILVIVMEPQSFDIEEITVTSKRPVTIKKDTIIFDAAFYSTGDEQVVQDLLTKIPGINVNEEGTISIAGKEVEKVMVEGDDFFERGYKILTKNMPSAPIDKVELLQNYSNNPLLKGIEASDRVALNLILKKEARRIWFGNVNIGYDLISANRYGIIGNLMNFGKINKYYFLTNLNNIGQDATGDIAHLIRPFRYDEPASIGDDQQVNNLLMLSGRNPELKKDRTNFNNAELLSLNAIFNPTDKLKVKTLGFFNWDEQNFFRNSTQIFTANETNFTNTEGYRFRNASITGFGKIDMTYNISQNKMLEATTKYNKGDNYDFSDLLFNSISTIENLQTNYERFDQKITFSNKFKKNKALLLTGRIINEIAPQNYTINRFFYQDLFPQHNVEADNAQQLSKNQMQFAGLDGHFFHRKQNGSLLEFQLGNQTRKDNLLTSFLIKNGDAIASDNITGFRNNTKYLTNKSYIKSKYRLAINNFAIISKLDIHQLFNYLEFEEVAQNQWRFFINPTIGIDWQVDKNNQITGSYSYNITNASIQDVFSNFVLTGFRSFEKGTGQFNQLDASTFFINHRLGNWSDKFFANTTILYSKNHDFFSTNNLITPNYSLLEKIVIKDREFLNISSDLNGYIKRISSNLKLDLNYSKSNFKNIVNNSALRAITSTSYRYGLELRSGLRGNFNFHIGTKWTTSEIKTTGINNTFTDNLTFLDLFFAYNNKIDMQLQTERYYFGNLDKDNNIYYFLDFNIRYTAKPNKLIFSMAGKNLFNTSTFRNFSINDLGTSTTEYRLLPRFVLLKLEFRF